MESVAAQGENGREVLPPGKVPVASLWGLAGCVMKPKTQEVERLPSLVPISHLCHMGSFEAILWCVERCEEEQAQKDVESGERS